MSNIGYRISFLVHEIPERREIVVVHDSVLALRMMAFATRDCFAPVLTTFEYEDEGNEDD